MDLFAADAVFEVPFGLQVNQKRLEGMAHFAIIAQNPSTKLLELHKVDAHWRPGNDAGEVTVEFRIEGKSVPTGKPFNMPSTVVIIRCEEGEVKYYEDLPNTIGYAEIAGVLPQLGGFIDEISLTLIR